MNAQFIKDFQPEQEITSYFLVQSKEIRAKKNGDPYLALLLADRTGQIEGKMWDNVAQVMHTFERDDFVHVRAWVQAYQNRLQLNIQEVRRADESEVDLADFFPASERDPEEMFQELLQVIQSIKNAPLRRLLEVVFQDEQIARKFRKAPAAKRIHHAYLGGLLEHVLSLCRLSEAVAAHYPFIDRDLMLAGAILHDIGKIDELAYRRSFGYTDEGQLLGHIVIGIRIVEDKLRMLPDFPPRLRTLVEHMIISHHGELEFGSPKVPAFAEALLLHFLDNLDAKMESIRQCVERETLVDGYWTAYHSALERQVLHKDRYLEEGDSEDIEGDRSGTPAASDVPVAELPRSEESGVPAQLGLQALRRPVLPLPDLPIAPPSKPARRTGERRYQTTLFGEKLQAALKNKDS